MKINGNLDFFALGSELRNAIIERLGADPATSVSGRMYYNTGANEYRYYNGTNWLPFGEGQLAEKLEAAMGGITTIDGDYDAAAVNTALTNLDTSTSTTLLDTLVKMDQARKDNADAIATAASGAVTYNSTTKQFSDGGTAISDVKVVSSIVSAKSVLIDGISVTVSDGGTFSASLSSDELNMGETQVKSAGLYLPSGGYITGAPPGEILLTPGNNYPVSLSGVTLTSYINNSGASALMPKQYIDDQISAVSGSLTNLALDGLSYVDATTNKTARNTLAVNAAGDGFELISARTIETTNTNALTIANGDGVAGNPSLTVEAGLESLAGLTIAADTMIVGTGADTFAVATLTQAGRDLLDDATAVDMQTTLGLGSMATKASDDYLALIGGTMTGAINMGTNAITNVLDPVAASDAANKGYVDGAVAGLSWKNPVVAASDANIDLAAGGLLTISGVILTAGDRVLVKNQTTVADNGIYVVDAGAWVRGVDMDATSPINEVNGAATLNLDDNIAYTVTSTVTAIGDAITWAPFTGATAINAGVGLAQSGNTMSVHLGAGIQELPTDGVGIEIHDKANSALMLTDNGTTRGDESDDDKLALMLNVAGGLEQNANGLAIKSTGVTLGMMATTTTTFAGNTGSSDVALGGTLTLTGTDPIDVTVAGGTATISVATATDTQMGVAKFAAADFTVTAGEVTMNALDAGSVTNAMLVNSTTAFTDDNGDSVAIALGDGLSLLTGDGMTSVVNVAGKSMTFSADVATAANLGSVKVGAGLDVAADGTISLNSSSAATTLAALTDVTANAASDVAGNILVANTTTDKYEAQAIHYVGEAATAKTSHTVNHNLGQKFVTVTVYDETNMQILPQSVSLTDADNLVVTFNQDVKCKVVVMGVPGLAVEAMV